MKICVNNSVTTFILICFCILPGHTFIGRTSRYRSVRETEREPGVISREKCKQYSNIETQIIKPTLSLLPRTATVKECGNSGNRLILGGEKALAREFPHMAVLGFGNDNIQWLCAGSLISERYVLTAAHCTYAPEIGNCSRIRLGDLNIVDTTDDAAPEEFNVIELIKHSEYKYPSQYNDIALIKLDHDVKFSKYIRPACININNTIPEKLVATGWGLTATHGNRSDDLLKVTLDVYDQPECNASYVHKISRRLKFGIVGDTQMCAGSKTGEDKDTCQGDSGGPLQNYDDCKHVVIGVTSIGESCGVLPGVYTKVSNYVKWIEDIVWPQ